MLTQVLQSRNVALQDATHTDYNSRKGAKGAKFRVG